MGENQHSRIRTVISGQTYYVHAHYDMHGVTSGVFVLHCASVKIVVIIYFVSVLVAIILNLNCSQPYVH